MSLDFRILRPQEEVKYDECPHCGGTGKVESDETPRVIFSANITHNLAEMADAAGIYGVLWHPYDLGIVRAGHAVRPLEEGLRKLKSDSEKYGRLAPENRWGTYTGLVRFVEKVLEACRANPDALVEADI